MFEVILGSPSKKFLKKCEKQLCERLFGKIDELAINPFPQDVKRVQKSKGKLFRVRVGAYRIQYMVDYETNQLIIFCIDKRPRAY